MFSNRVPGDRRPNAFTSALARAKARGPIVDLTTTNPTSAGFRYPADLLAPLADAAGLAIERFGLHRRGFRIDRQDRLRPVLEIGGHRSHMAADFNYVRAITNEMRRQNLADFRSGA